MSLKQQLLFEGVTFGPTFLADHAGQLMTDGRLALIELVANAYDAGATRVRITWPTHLGEEFSIEDDGTGMTPDEFQTRWRTLGYNRAEVQGKWAEFPPKTSTQKRKRPAFGQSGKGRHGAFCFGESYSIETWKSGESLGGEVRLTRGGREPFEFVGFTTKKKHGHGTRISAAVRRNLLATESVASAIGSKFLVDPEFSIVLNSESLDLLCLETVDSSKIAIDGLGDIEVHEIDPQASDRTTHLRGITWWVHGRMVGTPSWDGLDSAGAILDGRTAVAKRLSYVIKADILKPHVKADWSGFHATGDTNAVIGAVRQHVIGKLEEHLAANRATRKREALTETADALKNLPAVSQDAVGEFVEQVLASCPKITQGDLTKTVQVFATMEKARTGYDLLAELATCSADDIDRWTEIMRRWSATDARHVLGELQWRLDLIAKLEDLIRGGAADELHDLQPLFERGLWIFGPEYESVEFRSNRTLATVVKDLLGGTPSDLSSKRPDFVALPDRSIGLYAADSYDAFGEVAGIARILIVELKHGDSTLTRKEVSQPEDYVSELRSKNHVQAGTRFDVFVLGSRLADDAADERKVGEPTHTVIRPMSYERLIKRAHARTFNLLEKVRKSFPDLRPDAEVEAVLREGKTLFDGPTTRT